MKYRKIRLRADVHQFINYESLSDCLGEDSLKTTFSVTDLWMQFDPKCYLKSPFIQKKIQIPTNRSDWNLMKAQILSARESKYEDIPEDDAIAIGDKPNVVELLPLYSSEEVVPREVRQLAKKFDFYKVEFYTKLLPKKKHQIKQLLLSLVLSPNRSVKKRPAAYDIFPDTEWKTILKIQIDANLDVGIGLHLGYVARLLREGGFKSKANIDVGTKILGSFVPFVWRRVLVESGGQGSTCIDWRYRHKMLLGDIGVMLVMKVKKPVKTVNAIMSGTAVIQTGRLKRETFPYRIPSQEFTLLPL